MNIKKNIGLESTHGSYSVRTELSLYLHTGVVLIEFLYEDIKIIFRAHQRRPIDCAGCKYFTTGRGKGGIDNIAIGDSFFFEPDMDIPILGTEDMQLFHRRKEPAGTAFRGRIVCLERFDDCDGNVDSTRLTVTVAIIIVGKKHLCILITEDFG